MPNPFTIHKTKLPEELRQIHGELAKFAASLGWQISAVYIKRDGETGLHLVPVVLNCPDLASVLSHFEGLLKLMEQAKEMSAAQPLASRPPGSQA